MGREQHVQRVEKPRVRLPLLSTQARDVQANTAPPAGGWQAACDYYSINGMFANHLTEDMGISPAMMQKPIISRTSSFPGKHVLGLGGYRIGRRGQ